jgi:S-adenosylmethionine-diacylgycerolhomoserine-N-methlytransferase
MSEADTLARMERMYRPPIGIYDLTRKPYLLGRDRLIATMPIVPGDRVCEVGCGTGRNLARLAQRDRTLRLFGLDASATMLERAKQKTRAQLARGLAEQLDPAVHFGLGSRFDRVVFSYALSMIPDWRGALTRALASLRPGGTIAIVDFGDQTTWPGIGKLLLRGWLRLFGVIPVDGLEAHLRSLASTGAGQVEFTKVAGGYAQLAFFHKKT